MPARSLVCDTCGRTLGTISRKRDHRGAFGGTTMEETE